MENIIKTDNYLLIVSDEEIKEGDFLLSKEGFIHNNFGWNYGDKKITAHLPLNNSPILEGVDLLPLMQDETIGKPLVDYVFLKHTQEECIGFIDGYNKAKEKYNLTLDKLLDLYIEESGYGMDMWSKEENATMNIVTKIIQSLQQPKYPIGFECEMEAPYTDGYADDRVRRFYGVPEPKTTTNSQGQTVLVGTYIYE